MLLQLSPEGFHGQVSGLFKGVALLLGKQIGSPDIQAYFGDLVATVGLVGKFEGNVTTQDPVVENAELLDLLLNKGDKLSVSFKMY